MKKFQFSLEKMLDFKNQILDREKIVLGEIKKRQAELEGAIAKLNNKEIELSRELQGEQERGTTVLTILSYSSQIENIRRQVKELQKELADVRYQAECQTKVVVSASQEVSSLEKLQEKQLDEYKLEEKKENQEMILEYVITQMTHQA